MMIPSPEPVPSPADVAQRISKLKYVRCRRKLVAKDPSALDSI